MHFLWRVLPLPAFAVRALIIHKHRQAGERAFAGTQWREHGLVFASSVGTPIEPRNLLRHFHSTLDALNIDRRRFHDLRHTAASLLIAQGSTLHEVKEILGHSQIRLTADLYGHVYMNANREIISKMDDVISPEPIQKSVASSVAPQMVSKAAN
ncbi:MAG: tyrosine-type recombinase/integrase [Bryobacterales bacterium]|nr:tyrosine-type recombinase/integrase [Bryobacterales bacterium]